MPGGGSGIGWIKDEIEAEHDGATGERRAKLKRLGAASREFQVYIRRRAGSVIDYGERHRACERISSGVRRECAINQVVAEPFSQRQPIRWTKRGAHLAIQPRTRVLNGDLDVAFLTTLA